MVTSGLTREAVLDPAVEIAFPDSVVRLFHGDLGQPAGGFPAALQKKILGGKAPLKVRPGELLPPADLDADQVAGASLVFEASAKQLFGKDRNDVTKDEGDYMRGEGKHDPSANPNSYPMTDTRLFPSTVRVRINGVGAGTYDLPDDPADHRGVLSWHAQLRDKKLREAGSYGYLIQATIPADGLQRAAQAREIVVRLEVDAALPGGLALYGERFGRYPLDPTLVFTLR